MDNVLRFTTEDRHVERVEHELGTQMRCHGPTDDTPAEDVQDDRKKQKAGPRRHVGYVSDPKLIRCGRCKVPLDQIRCRSRIAIAYRGLETLATTGSLNSPLPHETRNTLVACVNTFITQVRLDARTAVCGA